MGMEDTVVFDRMGSNFIGMYRDGSQTLYFVQIHPFVFISPSKERVEWISDFKNGKWIWKVRKNVRIKNGERGYVINNQVRSFDEKYPGVKFYPLVDLERVLQKPPRKRIVHAPIIYYAKIGEKEVFIRNIKKGLYEAVEKTGKEIKRFNFTL